MPGKASSKATTESLFTSKQRYQLSKLLNDARPQKADRIALDLMDQLAAKFKKEIKALGFRPTVEDRDLALGSKSYAQRHMVRFEKLSIAERKKWWDGVGRADCLLLEFAADIGRCWKEATGRPLPKVKASVHQRCGEGYRRELAGLATTHPLWLILDALDLKVGARTVNELIRKVRPLTRKRAA